MNVGAALWYDVRAARSGAPRKGPGDMVGRKALARAAVEPVESPPEPKTHRGRRTRELIVAAARAVFEEKGFLETRIADIAAAAQMSHGTFYTYFQTKEEVFAAVLEKVAEAHYEATRVPADLPPDPAVRIEYTIRAYLRSYQKTARLSAVIEQVATINEDFRRARLGVRSEFRGRIERGIRRMQAQGLVDESLSARTAAEAITSMLFNFAFFSLSLQQEGYDEDEAVATLTRMWIGGIGLKSRS